MRRVVAFLLAAVLTAAGTCPAGRAAAAPPPGPVATSVPELFGQAPLIVVGRVAAIRPGRTAGSGEGKLQFSDVEVTIEKRLKGTPPAKLIVEQVATAGAAVSGAGPPYKVGERYVLFLRPGDEPRYVALPQGRYRLVNRAVHPVGPGALADRLPDVDETAFVSEIERLEKRRR